MTAEAFKGAYSLPSSGEKQGSETFRLHFKRRHTVEKTNLIVVKASDFLIHVQKEHQNGRTVERVHVRLDSLTLIGSLLETNQVAILIDYADLELTSWIFKVLNERLLMQVDAVYCYSSLYEPSKLLHDVTQIVNDFRLFSEF